MCHLIGGSEVPVSREVAAKHVDELCKRAEAGDERARGKLIALVYDELRRVASA